MNEFNNASEEDSFLRNLRMLSFNKQIEETFNLICGMCEEPFLRVFQAMMFVQIVVTTSKNLLRNLRMIYKDRLRE